MADHTKIEWADATLNAVNGCTRVSPGCGGPGPHGGCYAERLAGTRLRNHPSRAGLTKQTSAGPRWTGEVRLHEPALLQALRWRRPRRIFWNAHGDLFHPAVPDEWIDRLFAVCALTPQHTHMILTKRPERMREYVTELDGRSFQGVLDHFLRNEPQPRGGWSGHNFDHRFYAGDDTERRFVLRQPLPNVWLGTSVEDQQRADERIPHLLATPAAKRFLSCEPLLGPVDLCSSLGGTLWIGGQRGCGGMHHGIGTPDCPRDLHHHHDDRCGPGFDWVIVGGESGSGARPMHPDWARSLRDQCQAAGVALHFKQWGEWGHAFHLDRCHGVAAATTGTGHWPEPKRYRIFGGPLDGKSFESHPADHLLLRVGKSRAGRLLDGREWNEVPA